MCAGAGRGSLARAAPGGVPDHRRRALDAARLAGGVQRGAGRDGSDRRLLEARLGDPRGRVRVPAGERAARQAGSRSQDRCQGCRVALPAHRGRAPARELRSAEADPRAAAPDPVSQGADRRSAPREANRLHKALEDTGIKLDCVATDILGVSGRAMLNAHDRSGRAGRPSERSDAREDPGAARGARGSLRRAPRAADRRDPRAPRLPRSADRDADGSDRGEARTFRGGG